MYVYIYIICIISLTNVNRIVLYRNEYNARYHNIKALGLLIKMKDFRAAVAKDSLENPDQRREHVLYNIAQ